MEIEPKVTTHKIAVEALPRLQVLITEHNRKISKLNRRHGAELPPTSYSRINTVTDTVILRSGERREVVRAIITVSGARPILAGWEIVGSLTLTDEGYLLSAARGAHAIKLEAFKSRGGECDHCKTRRRRSTTYVLEGWGGLKIVGSTCITDFTGHSSPAALVALADADVQLDAELAGLEDDENVFGGGGAMLGGQRAVSLGRFLGFVRVQIRENGWVSRGEARDTGRPSTADLAWDAVQTMADLDRIAESDVPERDGQTGELNTEFRRAMEAAKPTADEAALGLSDVEEVTEVMSFKPESQLSDYEQNLLVVVRQGFVFGRNIGLAASVCRYVDRIREDRRRAEAEARRRERNEHFSTVGRRDVFRLTVVFTKRLEGGEWGPTHLHVMRDEQGRVAKWFSSTDPLEAGATYDLKATVKKHDEYQYRKETVLTRCVVVSKISDGPGSEVR